MYVNLEADIIPRTTLATDGDPNSNSSLRTIAKGTLNFLSSQVGDASNPNDRNFNTNWTDAYFETNQKKDKDGNPIGDSWQSDGKIKAIVLKSLAQHLFYQDLRLTSLIQRCGFSIYLYCLYL